MAILELTEAKIRSLPLGSGIHRDTDVKGLLVICHRTAKTYAVQGDVRRDKRHVRTVRVKIDRVDRIGLAEARRRAKALMSTIQSGIDPTARPPGAGVTVSEALKAHLSDRRLRYRTAESYQYHLDKYLSRFKNRPVSSISRQEARELFEHLREKSGETSAAGIMRTMRAIINTAMRMDETINSNPVMSIRLPNPLPRKVNALDVAAWWSLTENQIPQKRDLHRALLLTGARITSMVSLRREDVDKKNAVLTFRHLKVGDILLFPMGRWLKTMLAQRLEEDELWGSEWLWPSGSSKSGHLNYLRRETGLPSPHELRHLHRTMAIAAGLPYAESALLLGQRLPGASGGYVHREHLVEALRPWAQKLEDYVLRLASLKQQTTALEEPGQSHQEGIPGR